MIRPEDFGAAGDGRADDTKALQAAFDHAEGAGVLLAGRAYRTSATLLVPSGTTVQGLGAVIQARADDRPILASKAWEARRADTRGRTRILGLRLEGTGRGQGQDGIVLHDFWSELADLEIVNTGGRGLVLTATDRTGTPIASTLVDNKIRGCTVRDSAGTAFFLGEPANGKLTDGELSDCIAVAKAGATDPIVSIGHAAGWTVRNLHTYGGRPKAAVEIRQAYFTRLSDLYIEGFGEAGLSLPQIQTDVAVSNLQVVAETFEPGAAFIDLSGHRDYPHPNVLFANVTVTNLGGSEAVALRNRDRKVSVGGAPIVISGPGAGRVRPGDRAGGPAATMPASATALEAPKRIVTWTGREPRTVEVASRSVREAFADAFILALTGRSSDGGLTTQFAGMLHWRRAGPDAEAVLVDLVPFGTASGFERLPDASFVRQEDRLALTLAFTPIASGPGQLTIA